MKSVRADKVFTPTTPARLTFVERQTINDKVVDAIQTPGKQVVVYGHSGSGKSTLLVNKLHQLYEKHITTRCMSTLTFDQICLDPFDQLRPFYSSEIAESSAVKVSAAARADYVGIKSQIGAELSTTSQRKHLRVAPPQLTPQALARFLGEAGCCWVLEDFHKIAEEEKTNVSQLMKVFMDMADVYRDLKIIAIGAVDTARQVVQYDPEMRNRVAEIQVPLMTSKEIREIIDKGEHLLNFRLPEEVRESIVWFSNGLASVCHHLCLNICRASSIVETCPNLTKVGKEHLTKAIEQYISEASDSLKYAFDRAFRIKRKGRYDNCRIIIEALAGFEQEGAPHGEIMDRVKRKEKNYPAGNLTYYLNQLTTPARGTLLRLDATSGRFSFADPIYRAFALSFFKKHPDQRIEFKMIDISEFVISDLKVAMLKDFKVDVVWKPVSQGSKLK